MLELTKERLRQLERQFSIQNRESYTLIELDTTILESFEIGSYIKVTQEQIQAILFSIDYFKENQDEEYLFKHNINPQLFIKYGTTPGHYAVQAGENFLRSASIKDILKLIDRSVQEIIRTLTTIYRLADFNFQPQVIYRSQMTVEQLLKQFDIRQLDIENIILQISYNQESYLISLINPANGEETSFPTISVPAQHIIRHCILDSFSSTRSIQTNGEYQQDGTRSQSAISSSGLSYGIPSKEIDEDQIIKPFY